MAKKQAAREVEGELVMRETPAPIDTLAKPLKTAKRFRVSLSIPTPLAHESLDVEATNEQEAWSKFCEANGISGSDHPRTIRAL